MKKLLLTELTVSILTLVTGTGLYAYFFGVAALGRDTLDVNIHDTYIVFERTLVILLFFLLLYVIVNAFRQVRLHFKNSVANVMLIIASLLAGLDISRYIQLASMMMAESDMTIYPPLSAMPQASPSSILMLVFIFYVLWAIEVFLGSMVVLTLVMICCRKKQSTSQSITNSTN